MILNLIALLFPALAFARIDLELTGTFNKDVQVEFSGYDVDVISNTEIDSFQLTGSNLKPGIEAYFGAAPSEVAFKNPTPWGDLYTTYGWKQVTRTLVPTSSRVVSMSTQEQVVMQQVFENKSPVSAIYNLGMVETAHNTVKSSWNSQEELTNNDELNIGIVVNTDGGDTAMKLDFTLPWGIEDEKSQTVKVGAKTLEVTLKPEQTVTAQLVATKGTLVVEVEYEASLSGDLAAYYEDTYKDQYYWAVGVEPVMSKAELVNSLKATQTIEFNFYMGTSLLVTDVVTQDKVLDVAL